MAKHAVSGVLVQRSFVQQAQPLGGKAGQKLLAVGNPLARPIERFDAPDLVPRFPLQLPEDLVDLRRGIGTTQGKGLRYGFAHFPRDRVPAGRILLALNAT